LKNTPKVMASSWDFPVPAPMNTSTWYIG
jgi:hypothetical protein